MNRHEGDGARLSFNERLAISHAIREGSPIPDPVRRRYALRRIQEARIKFHRLQTTFEANRKLGRFSFWLMIAVGAAVLLSGLSPMNTMRVVIGAADVGLGAIFLLLWAFVGNGLNRLTESAHDKEEIYSQNS